MEGLMICGLKASDASFADVTAVLAIEFVTICEIGIFYLYQRLNNLSSIYVFIGRKPHRHLIRPPC